MSQIRWDSLPFLNLKLVLNLTNFAECRRVSAPLMKSPHWILAFQRRQNQSYLYPLLTDDHWSKFTWLQYAIPLQRGTVMLHFSISIISLPPSCLGLPCSKSELVVKFFERDSYINSLFNILRVFHYHQQN